MIDQLLSLSSKLNNDGGKSSSSSSSGTSSTSKGGTTSNASSAKKLSLKQLIQVNESLLDSFFLFANNTSNNSNSNLNDDSDDDSNVNDDDDLSQLMTVGDLQSILVVPNQTQKGDDDNTIDRSSGSENETIIIKLLNKVMSKKDNEKEFDKCLSILLQPSSSSSTDEEILMVVQYLFRLSLSSSSVEVLLSSPTKCTLYNIINITYPLLLASPTYSTQLRDAILDATFLLLGVADSDDNTTTKFLLSSCLSMIQQSTNQLLQITISDANNVNVSKKTSSTTTMTPEWIVTVITISSQVLSRVLDLFLQIQQSNNNINDNDATTNVLDTIHDISLSVLDALCYYSPHNNDTTSKNNGSSSDSTSSGPLLMNGRTSSLLRIVTSLLLPCLLRGREKEEEEKEQSKLNNRMLSLWDFIHDLIAEDTHDIIHNKSDNASNETKDESRIMKKKCRTWASTAPSVASGILCIIVEHMYSLPLPLTTVKDNSPAESENKSESNHSDAASKAQSQSVRLVQHKQFWNFIQKALNCQSSINADHRGMKGGGTFLARGGAGGGGDGNDGNYSSNPYIDESGMEDENVGQLVRRRSIHILRLLIEKEYDELFLHSDSNKKSGLSHEQQNLKSRITTWKKYILCFEALEMEEEVHLVDQVWETVIELCAACCQPSPDSAEEEEVSTIPQLSWDMVGSLFARVLLSESPILRKLGLFRLLSGRAGIALNDNLQESDNTSNKKGKGKKKNKKSKKKAAAIEPSPISLVSCSFILEVLIPSYDSLSVLGFNFANEGKVTNHDLSLMIGPFITIYTRSLMKTPGRLEEFIKRVLSAQFIESIRVKTLVIIFKAVADVWAKDSSEQNCGFLISNETIVEAVKSLSVIFNSGGIVFDYRQGLSTQFAIILSNSIHSSESKKPDPLSVILDTLILYVSTDEVKKEETKEEMKVVEGLKQWVGKYGKEWVATVCAACASSFISGQLISFEKEAGTLVLNSARERQVGTAISKLCFLVGSFGNTSPSSMLWPAISKGLSNIPIDSKVQIYSPLTAQQASRALILLESGCRERVLNGIGHGDLVIDKQGNMLPPPPNIELLLSRAINFLLHQLNRLSICDVQLKTDETQHREPSALRSTHGSYLPNHFAAVINQLVCLKRAYPSSVITSKAIYDLLIKALKDCTEEKDSATPSISDVEENVHLAKNMCVLFGTLTFAGESILNNIAQEKNLAQCCLKILSLQFNVPNTASQYGIQTWQIKAMRSIFQHAKWGSLSLLLPLSFESPSTTLPYLHDTVIDTALDSVNATPAKGLLPLFGCVIVAAKNSFDRYGEGKEKGDVGSYIKNMTKAVDAIFTIIDDTEHSPTRAYMLQCLCNLVFCPQRLIEEYNVFQIIRDEGSHPEEIALPIRSAFRKLINMAGTKKPHISKYALSYISSAWVGTKDTVGLSAIPYRADIAKLLIHKEAKLDETNSHKEGLVPRDDIQHEGVSVLPADTPETSVARAFLMTFISSLPNVGDCLPKDVERKVCYYLIFWLLDEVCLQTDEVGAMMVNGGTIYCQVIRAWQSLCLLSRFVTSEIAELVAQRVFKAMSITVSGQIKYFIEVFTIQCARKHPNIFGKTLITEIKKINILQQYVCSLMIISGNLIVGKYSDDFIKSSTLNQGEFDIKEIIAAVVPWLGSTQSFCRAIAQLLLHKLVPLAFPSVSNDSMSTDMEKVHNDWFFVKNTWLFLENNNEMQKLRKKQLRFFESYETDSVCTPEGIFRLGVDEIGESNPSYFQGIKQCLIDIGNENAAEVPEWKRMEEMLHEYENDRQGGETGELVNFQRKILPVDTLNLTLENYKQQKRQNAAGRYRQSLIVCASLINKVTNLGGITRTAEIFAADKVLIPDSKICKMDNFKSISVGAGDWVTIEECKESDLLRWLKQCKKEGYEIIGVEQTSSSKSLSNAKFKGKSVLLLGKEKEGIPQEFLNVVDQCVEIPQLGVIRSLNVHVSGAICMWEYTKQMMMNAD